MIDSAEETQADRIERKLDQIIEFQEKLAPHLPLLERAAKLLNNPAASFLTIGRKR